MMKAMSVVGEGPTNPPPQGPGTITSAKNSREMRRIINPIVQRNKRINKTRKPKG
jgi:hypothetical protein